MFKYRFSKFFFWSLSSLIVFIFFIFLFRSSISPYISSMTSTTLSTFDALVSKPFTVVKETFSTSKDLVGAFEENKVLKKELRELKNNSMDLEKLKKENEELKGFLKADLSAPFQVMSQSIVRTPQLWDESLVISSGKAEKIKENMLVTVDSALIGKVTSSTLNSSRVDLLTNGRIFDLPIKIEDGSTVIYGNLKSFNQEKKVMQASEFNSNDKISKGSRVFTSGLDGETVADIPIGKVVYVKNDDDKLKRQFDIELDANFSNINYVKVMGKQ
ncbi:rod shape-determining protein MreC [Streptococcus catagoni]|uniref:rod shape-determining protein MreC n=1 Tax=Streptococcus catagoni TaxID=2654874 RepID=UPI00140B11AC|nr:rod shape-determining protein MreC [Streptococcus catagoni]